MVSKNGRYSLGRKKWNIYDTMIYVMVGVPVIFTVWPFIYVFSMSISDPIEAARQTVWLYPKGFSLSAYDMIVSNSTLWASYLNTIFYVSTGTVINLFMAAISAYPLSRRHLFGRKYIVLFFIIPMYFSGGLIPYFILINKLHLYNKVWVLIIPTMMSIWNVILTRTFFATIPDAIPESAMIDGANDFQILLRLVMPLSKPILAVVGLYTAVGIWNSWFPAMIFLPDAKYQPLQLYLTKVVIFQQLSLDSANSGARATQLLGQASPAVVQLKYAVIFFCTLPIVCVFPFLQKYFIKGALVGSLKQ
ncbi:MAG: carbohydrate ABC transporter permease [Ruminiclostridium sp.]|nr:carbohydrate ABC transporter permease [Ruminiclostridium sp.]